MFGQPRYWVIIPAAGEGQRMDDVIPKQYLKLDDKTILEHSIAVFQQLPEIKEIMVVIAQNDNYWSLLTPGERVSTTAGGVLRIDSVLNGLLALENKAVSNDWVLVHDAARPLVRSQDVLKLMESLKEHPVGGLLATPVRDTLKKSGNKRDIEKTIDRNNLWCALTPQMFRYGLLVKALKHVILDDITVTDEAMAIELLSKKPQLVEGRADNIKITYPADLEFAKAVISTRRSLLK